MPTHPRKPCITPGCPGKTLSGRCARCKATAQANPRLRQLTPAQAGYDADWRATRLDYLMRHPVCALCGRLANVADHYPVSRRHLIAQGVPDPDADERLRPLCKPCHDRQTGLRQPGGWRGRDLGA